MLNHETPAVTDFGPDPRGTGYFNALNVQGQLGISGHDGELRVGDKGSPERSFNGDVGGPVQHFTGAAALAMYGAAKPISTLAATFDTAHAADALNNAPMRIFAARAAREATR
jgi:hypothetical protein